MRENGGVAHTQETLSNDSRHFKTIKALRPHLRKNSSNRVPEFGWSKRSKEHHLYFGRHEEEVPACGMDLAIQSEAVESLDHAPFPGVGLTCETKEFRNLRTISDQDRSDLYSRSHEFV